MKDIKIYPKDWLQLHPYKQSDPTDLYYTNIANRIYGMLEETNLAYSFEKNEVKQISIRMAAYFEDVIMMTRSTTKTFGSCSGITHSSTTALPTVRSSVPTMRQTARQPA